ncbi:methanogenesis marker 14 protein [Methanococcus maripaludis]|uniref:Putative methanogenesis marker protein 14 n=1 Tax=Methanococcus maripaludis TaxID=39152 RepID=A0A7J9S2N9_METMI|nr:methanogenesis marker 14 protein [Methanococcus maripaludis]MBB6066972.1 putative methanogenesis marker protein 14 [Methanococcus maripaludis]
MGFLDSIKGIFSKSPKIHYAKSQSIDVMDLNPKRVGPNQHILPYYTVASVELGNTTTKAIISATEMGSGKTYVVSKEVRMTRDVRPPKKGEQVFGRTIWDVELTKEAVSEMVRDVLKGAMDKAHLNVNDLHFVVRSTGVTAGFATPEEVGVMIVSLAEGCRMAGIPNGKMTPIMTKKQLPEILQDYTLIEKLIFDGAVTGVVPPTGKEVVANEMEGELVTAGLKIGSKWTGVDYRNPCISIDFGTTLAGRITNNGEPYAKVVGNLCGLAGAVSDAVVRGTDLVNKRGGAVLDIHAEKGSPNKELAKKYAEEIHEHVIIKEVPKGMERFGTVPVNPESAEKAGTFLIGCDVGENGSDIPELEKIGAKILKESNLPTLMYTLDIVSSKITQRLIKIAHEEGIINGDTAIGITGRAGITGEKPKLIIEMLSELGIWDNVSENIIFVEDGLALGASVMARCMNCLGTPKVPIGGKRNGPCILSQRIKRQKEMGMIK